MVTHTLRCEETIKLIISRFYMLNLIILAYYQDPEAPHGMLGDVWEWTESSYSPYPGFKAPRGAVGEYNGKFMVNQMVLRGASCGTPPGHARITYGHVFYPRQRWSFAGLRLAE
jgi:formylglycine-generating enzyme required for sulfatase activity